MMLTTTFAANDALPIALFLGVALVAVVVIWQIFATWRARMVVAREDAYRSLAAQASEAQQKTAAQLEQLVGAITDVQARTAELERVLKSVE